MEYLYTIENLKRILGPSEVPEKALSECAICSRLPDKLSKINIPERSEFGSFPLEVSRLEEFILIKYSWLILKCPLCGRLYTDEYRYEHLVGGSEDVYVVSRIDYRECLELLKDIKAKKLVKDGDRWLVIR